MKISKLVAVGLALSGIACLAVPTALAANDPWGGGKKDLYDYRDRIIPMYSIYNKHTFIGCEAYTNKFRTQELDAS